LWKPITTGLAVDEAAFPPVRVGAAVAPVTADADDPLLDAAVGALLLAALDVPPLLLHADAAPAIRRHAPSALRADLEIPTVSPSCI